MAHPHNIKPERRCRRWNVSQWQRQCWPSTSSEQYRGTCPKKCNPLVQADSYIPNELSFPLRPTLGSLITSAIPTSSGHITLAWESDLRIRLGGLGAGIQLCLFWPEAGRPQYLTVNLNINIVSGLYHPCAAKYIQNLPYQSGNTPAEQNTRKHTSIVNLSIHPSIHTYIHVDTGTYKCIHLHATAHLHPVEYNGIQLHRITYNYCTYRYVQLHAATYNYVTLYIHTHAHTYVHTDTHTHTYICTYSTYIHTYIHTCTYILTVQLRANTYF